MSDEIVLDKAGIVNWALSEIGLAPTFTIDDATGLGAQVAIFWPRAVGHCFGLHDWTFCRRTTKLSRQEAIPQTGYRHGFDLPGDKIGPPMKLLSDPRRQEPLRDWRIEGQTLYADEPDAWATCKVPVAPAAWDWQWASAFATCLASMLAVPLTQDMDLAAEKWGMAFGSPSQGGTGGIFGRLIAQDRTAGPVGANMLVNDPLTTGRGGGAWHGKW